MKKGKLTVEEIRYRAYKEGLRAAYSGKSLAHCPYPYSSEEGQRWAEGYQDGGGTE